MFVEKKGSLSSVHERPVGFVCLIGRPNAGKSTLLNALIQEKTSIVSPVPQTTQSSIRGIYTTETVQIIFEDTPGIHSSTREWNQHINQIALQKLNVSDIILRCIDSSRPYGEEEIMIDTLLKTVSTPYITVYTKTDIALKPLCRPYDIALSSVTRDGLDTLIKTITKLLPTGPLLYPEDIYTDQDMSTRIREIIREKVCLHFFEEIPHSVYVELFEIDHRPEKLIILGAIFVESESQKRILIGKGGTGIHILQHESQDDISAVFGVPVRLGLRIKVHPNWRKKDALQKKILR